MGRGRARDTLPPETATRVREVARSLRDERGLTNAEVARKLEWDDRQVTNALQEDQPLRHPKALALLGALRSLPSRKRVDPKTVSRILADVSTLYRELTTMEYSAPAVLVAIDHIGPLVELIAQRSAVLQGFSPKKIEEFKKQLHGFLGAESARFAFAAYGRLGPTIGENAAREVLARFGYEVI